MTKKDDVFAPAEKPVFGPPPGTDPESGRDATPPPPTPARKPRSDRGKPRPRPQTDRAVEHADKVIERMVELAKKAHAIISENPSPEDLDRACLYTEEAIVIGEGGDREAWLESKVYP